MPKHDTIFEMFAATAEGASDHPFLIVPARADRNWHPDGVQYSYGETLREVPLIAAQAVEQGSWWRRLIDTILLWFK